MLINELDKDSLPAKDWLVGSLLIFEQEASKFSSIESNDATIGN